MIKIGRRTWLRWLRDDTRSTVSWSVRIVHNRKRPIA